MIKKQVDIVYEVYCDECGAKVGEWRMEDNYMPKREDFLKQFKMFRTPDGKDICQDCLTKNFGKYCVYKSPDNVDKCGKL